MEDQDAGAGIDGWQGLRNRMTGAELPGHRVHLEAYTGPLGAQGQAYTAKMQDGLAVFETTHRLAPGEGFTIVASWPKGFERGGRYARPPPSTKTSSYSWSLIKRTSRDSK